eukprot:scaffold1673_cov15-Tisochrysis_lutea.AAC.1
MFMWNVGHTRHMMVQPDLQLTQLFYNDQADVCVHFYNAGKLDNKREVAFFFLSILPKVTGGLGGYAAASSNSSSMGYRLGMSLQLCSCLCGMEQAQGAGGAVHPSGLHGTT